MNTVQIAIWVGTAVGLAGLGVAFFRSERLGVRLGTLGAFGVFYLVLRQATAAASASAAAADPTSGADYPFSAALLVAVAVQSGSLLITLATASRHTIKCVAPSRRLVTFTAAIGLLDAVGDLALTYAIALGPVSLVGPLGSLDPMVAVLLASIFFKEPLTRKRAFGLAACAAGIALVAV